MGRWGRIVWLAVPGVLVILLVAFVVGWTVTPRVDGRPIVYSPSARAILRYARAGVRWAEDLEDIEALLLEALPSTPTLGSVDIEQPEHLRVQPGILLTYAERAKQARSLAVELSKEIDTTQAPEGMQDLHAQVLELTREYAAGAEAVQAYLALPTRETAVDLVRRLGNLAQRRNALLRDFRALNLQGGAPTPTKASAKARGKEND